MKIYLPLMTGATEIAAAPEIERRQGDELARASADEVVQVLPARDGDEGLASVRDRQRIDILFTDVVQPGPINGRRFADEARRLRPALPVLFTTGYTRNAIVHDGRLDSDVTLLSKPYTQEILAQALRRMIDQVRDTD